MSPGLFLPLSLEAQEGSGGPMWEDKKVAMHCRVWCRGVSLAGWKSMNEAPGGVGRALGPVDKFKRDGRSRTKKRKKKKKRTKKRDHVLRMAEMRGEKRVRDKN